MTVAIIVSILLFGMLMVGITGYGYRRYAKPGRFYERLGHPVVNSASNAIVETTTTTEDGLVIRVLQKLGECVPVAPADISKKRRELMTAGYRNESAIRTFYGLKIVLTILFLIIGLGLRGAMKKQPAMGFLMAIATAGMGFIAPAFLLEKRIKARHERLRLSLPDALDLMVVSVEAGLGLDQAIQHVAHELQTTHKDVAEELGLVTLEMRAGKRRAEALRNLADRTGEPELRKLVAILVQNDRFGTSMAESLRTHSDFMRVRRRQEAEERAGAVGVKLVFPIFFFILPAMMTVAAGPGLLQVFKYLFPMMSQVH